MNKPDWMAEIAQLRVDNGSNGYRDAVLDIAKGAMETLPAREIRSVLNDIAETCEAQYPLALALERLADTIAPQNIISSGFNQTNIDSQATLFEFLSAPLTPQTIDSFITANPNAPQGHGHAEKFHYDFWLADDDERHQYLCEFLDTNQDERTFKHKINTAAAGLIDAFLPPQKRGSMAYEYGQRFVRAIGETLNNDDLTYMISQALKAIHGDRTNPQSKNPDIRFGHRLNQFLVGIGGAKIAQAIHSFPKTPKTWKIGLKHSKSNAAPLSRFEFLKRAMDIDWAEHIRRIGKKRGTGTYIDVGEIEFAEKFIDNNPDLARAQSRDGLVVQIVKDEAASRSQRIFDLSIKTIRTIMSHDTEAQKSIGGIIPVIEHKAQMIAEETDMGFAGRKALMAAKILAGLKIERGKLRAQFHTQGLFYQGTNHRISRNIHGLHFNQLPEKTWQDRKIKAFAAEAIVTSILLSMSSGRPFDHDKHGENQGIKVHKGKGGKIHLYIGDFDDGAIILNPPTEKQKHLFADIVMDAMANSAINGFNPISSLKHTFATAQTTKALENKDDLNYVNAMVEAVLALGDYMPHISKAGHVRIIRAVTDANQMDQGLTQRFIERYQAIEDLRAGKSRPEEQSRRNLFYPPPTPQNQRYCSRLNKKLGHLALKWGAAMLNAPSVGKLIGTTKIILPDDYATRFDQG